MQSNGRARHAGLAALASTAALVVIFALISACGSKSEIRTVSLPGPIGDRAAIVYHPASAGPGAPLVIVSHGANGSAELARKSFGWDALARRYGFVVAYPEALDGRWNAGFCCRKPNSPQVDDVAFLHDLREELIAGDEVDPKRVFAVGASNGGMLSYAWACTRPGDVAAIGIVAGALTVDCPNPAPVTVVAVHGAADQVVPVAGGASVGGPGNSLVYPSIDEALAPFKKAADCPADAEVEVLAAATVSTWHCADGHEIVRDVIAGVVHGWPGSGVKAGTTTAPWDSTGFLWSRIGNVNASTS